LSGSNCCRRCGVGVFEGDGGVADGSAVAVELETAFERDVGAFDLRAQPVCSQRVPAVA
jgi:hypothetical protein